MFRRDRARAERDDECGDRPSDLRGFTHLSDTLLKEIVDLLNSYFECMVVPVEERGVIQFVGDGVLAIFLYDNACPHEMSDRR